MQGMSSLSFDGTSDPKEFFKSFFLQASMFNWDNAKQAKVLPLYLKGKAERIYNAMPADKDKIEEIEKAIVKGCTQSQEVLLHAFYSRKPKEAETLSQFALALQDLLTKAVPTMGDTEKAIFLRQQLNAHLPIHMRALIQFNSKQSWDDLLVALDEASPHVDVNFFNFSSQSGIASVKQEPLDVNATSISQKNNNFMGVCHYCKKPGHKIADCFKREQAQKRNNNNNTSKYRNQQEINTNRFRNSQYNNNSGFNQCSRNSNNRQNSYRACNFRQPTNTNGRAATSNTIDVFTNESEAESNTIELNQNDQNKVLDVMSVATSVPLMKRTVIGRLPGDPEKFKVKALFDGGATNSFIRLSCLPQSIREKIEDFRDNKNRNNEDFGFRKESFTIRGATSSVVECCVIAKFEISIRDWTNEHEFIVTNNIRDKEIILGRDFLKLYNVVIDHGSDSIVMKTPNKTIVEEKVTFNDRERPCVLLNNIIVEPRTEKVVKCRVSDPVDKEVVLFNPSNVDSSHLCAYSIAECVNEGEIFVSILNPTDKEIHLESNFKLGTVSSQFSIIENSKSVEVKSIRVDNKSKQVESKIDLSNLNKIKFGTKLTEEQKLRLVKLIKKKYEAFQLHESDLGLTDLIEHKIDTGTNKPIKQRQHRIPPTMREEVDKQVQEMLSAGIIEKSESPWSSPMLMVKQKKRDGSIKYRFVIDMRKLNEITIKDAYPLPRIDQTLDAIGNSAYLTVLDAARGYFQVNLKEEDREKTAFVANNELYQFKRMALGLTNAPSTYSRLMDVVLSGLTYKYCLVYLDDTIIFSITFEDHFIHVEEILDRFTRAKLKLRREKCVFAADEVPYLGFVITTTDIRPDADKVKAILDMPFPSSAKGMIRFLGAVNFYRDFIPHFSFIASILYKMSQSNSKFKSKVKS